MKKILSWGDVFYGCTLQRDILLVEFDRRVVCAKVVGATSSEGFLVNFVNQLHTRQRYWDCQLINQAERVQALADVSSSALCCHRNATGAPISNPLNSAQLGWTPYHSPKLHPGPCRSDGMRRGTDRHTDRHRRAWAIYISRRLRFTPNVKLFTLTWMIVIVWCM